jgi:hypothetical protein
VARYIMHDLVHDLATLIMADELIPSDVASKSNNKHGQKYCRYALVTQYDQLQPTELSCILPSNVRALHFLIVVSWILLVEHFHLQSVSVFWNSVDALLYSFQALLVN